MYYAEQSGKLAIKLEDENGNQTVVYQIFGVGENLDELAEQLTDGQTLIDWWVTETYD